MNYDDAIINYWQILLANTNKLINLLRINKDALLIGLILGLVIIGLIIFLKRKTTLIHYPVQTQDLVAIAGEEVISTQLDLAKAYIEMDRPSAAHPLLVHVINHGNLAQRKEANQLLQKI